jgi:hypothetical protein
VELRFRRGSALFLLTDASSTLKTSEVVTLLKVPYYRIDYLLRAGRVSRPARDGSGDFVWSEQDVDRLRRELAALTSRRRPREAVRGA